MSVAVALSLAFSASGQTVFPPNNSVVDRAALGVGTSFVALDLSSAAFLDQAVNNGNNSYSENFATGNYAGNLTVEVFGNQSSIGAGLTDVLLIYTFLGAGSQLNGIESFTFGVDTTRELDFGTLKNATHGNIESDTSLLNNQALPSVGLTQGAVDTMIVNFNDGVAPVGDTDELGGSALETFTWYVQTSGDVKLNFVDVRVTNFGAIDIKSLALVTDADTPNLGTPVIPLPTAAGMGLVGLGLLTMRRRR